MFLQKFIYNFYHHYFLNYRSLLNFEKKVKNFFFEICSKLRYEDYLNPESVNEIKRAQNASINIFRLYQIVVEIAATVIGTFVIGVAILNVNSVLLVFLFFSVASPILDNIYKIIQKKHLLYKNTQLQKEEHVFLDFLSKADYLKEIKELGAFPFIYSKWLNLRNTLVKEQTVSETKILFVSALTICMRICSTFAAYYTITSLYIHGEITLAELSTLILTFSQTTALLNQLFSLFGNLTEFSVMVQPFFDFLNKTKSDYANGKSVENDEYLILSDVSYSYPNSKCRALNKINLSIKRGQLIAIVGENGSGKTTLSNIIMGFLIPTDGEIKRISNNVQNDDSVLDLTLIPQDFNCYAIPIKDNISFSKDISAESIVVQLESVGLLELENLIEKEYGLEFGGLELSGGQKQKIAILRAINKKCGLLVCDEPTSAIDPLQEGSINREILKLSEEYTTVLISHRLALAKYADKIIVLKDGEIAESGTHNSLLSLKGIYAQMWNSQAELFV